METIEDRLLPLRCQACGTDFSLLPGAKLSCPVCIVGKVIPRTSAPTTDDAPVNPVRDPAADLLDEAKKIVTGARRQSYGTPEDNFGCIADLWTTFVQRRFRRNDKNSLDPVVFKPADVAVMMILMKCARLAETPDHRDSTVDIAGYAACLARC